MRSITGDAAAAAVDDVMGYMQKNATMIYKLCCLLTLARSSWMDKCEKSEMEPAQSFDWIERRSLFLSPISSYILLPVLAFSISIYILT